MKFALRLMTLAFAVALGLAIADCGSSPSKGSGTVLGTVTNTPAQLRVSVEGTNLSTTTNSSGQFTLRGVPSGTVALRFVGGGVDVRIEISGLNADATMRITVRITGSGAVVLRAPNELELTGTIESVDPPNLKISGLTVITNGNTELKRHGERVNLADLAVGQLVRVDGSLNADGTVLAQKIRVLVSPDQNRVRIRGVIDSITPPNLMISGLTIVTDANTRFDVHTLANLMVGDVVQVDGTIGADGTVLARSIEKIMREDEEEDEDDD
jgi:hypothetical protein